MKVIVIFMLLFTNFYASDSTFVQDRYGNKYGFVISPYTGKIWLDRNLGAKRVCQSIDDELCFGDYFQWGRRSDGHEKKTSKIVTEHAQSFRVSHGKFIAPKKLNTEMGEGWLLNDRSGNFEKLWHGEAAPNNPCPTHFRVPTSYELTQEIISSDMDSLIKAYQSFLKIPHASIRFASGKMDTWKWANLWSSDYFNPNNSITFLTPLNS